MERNEAGDLEMHLVPSSLKSVEDFGHYSKSNGEQWKAVKPISDQTGSPGCSGE